MRSEVIVDYRALDALGPSPGLPSSVPSRPTLRTYAASPVGLQSLQAPVSAPRTPLTAGALYGSAQPAAIPAKPPRPAKQTAAANPKKPEKPKIKTTPTPKPEPPAETAESELTPPPAPSSAEPPPEPAAGELPAAEEPPPPEMAQPDTGPAGADESMTTPQPEVAAVSETPPPPPEVPATSEPPPEAAPAAPEATAEAQPPSAPPEESTATPPPAEQTQTASLPPAEGQLRIQFTEGSAELPATAQQELSTLAQKLSANEAMRIQLLAYASGTADTASRARRMSLSRALAVRSYLIGQGVRSTRMDVRALGNNVQGEPADRVDIIPQAQ